MSSQQLKTLDALADEINDIFGRVKRRQFYFGKLAGCGDFYYYTFVGHLYNRLPLDIVKEDLEPVKAEIAKLNSWEMKRVMNSAIKKFLTNNGQEYLLNLHYPDGQIQWRLV